MVNFTVEPEVLRNCGGRIRGISDNALSQTIASLDSVKNGIDKVSPDLIQTMDSLIERARKNKARVAGLGQAADEIGRCYELAETNIVNYNQAFGNVGIPNGKVHGGGGGAHFNNHGNEDKSFWDTLKVFAEIFGMSFWQAVHLFGDLIQLIGAGGWEAVTGWTDGYDWKEWAYKYVPNHVDDQTLLLVLTLLSAHSLSSEVSQQHLESNIKAWEEYLKQHSDDYYIEHQGDMKNGLCYGNHEASYNACEVIAVYNALLALHDGNSPASFPELLYTFEQAGICADGEFGTDPVALYLYFQANNYETKMLSGGQIKDSKLNSMQKEYDTYILTTYNDGNNLGEMIHTVSITAETIDGETKYQIHNASDTTTYDSLAEAVEGYNDGKGEPISIIGVR